GSLGGISQPVVLRLALHYYYLNCRSRVPWFGTTAARVRDLKRPQSMRDARHQFVVHDGGREAGWHFSYVGGAEAVRSKIEAFSHVEYDSEEYKSIPRLTERMLAARDIFERPDYDKSFSIVPIDDRMPAHVVAN